jgi:uncharacterized protein (TIGR02145 family)
MKRILMILLFAGLFLLTEALYAQKLLIYKKVGATEEHLLSEIKRIEIKNKTDDYIMYIYSGDNLSGSHSTINIDSIKFDSGNMFVYHVNGSTSYSTTVIDSIVFRTDSSSGNSETVTIGTQVWMKKNLDVSHYRNGDTIPEVRENWGGPTIGRWCYYENDSANGSVYGKLYNWYAVDDSRGLAPEGYHVPSDDEWKTLEMYLGMTQTQADSTGWRGSPVSAMLRETGTTHWDPNYNATNSSNFTALPGGYRYLHYGAFYFITTHAVFWTSTYSGDDGAWLRDLWGNNSENTVYRGGNYTWDGNSVRCVRDLLFGYSDTLVIYKTNSTIYSTPLSNVNSLILEIPLVADAGNDTTICNGSSITIGKLAGGGKKPYIYLWSPTQNLNNPNIAQPTASLLVTTKYYVTVTDSLGSTNKDSVLITVNPAIIADAGNDTTISHGSDVIIGKLATGGTSPYTYSWTPNTNLSDANIAQPVASPLISTMYYVLVTDAIGCTNSDSIFVTIIAAVPTVSTTSISNITNTSASCGGNITSDGGADVTARGVCWNTLTIPTIANNKTSDGIGTGSFTSSLTGLMTYTTYYVRAYSTNSVGTAYGNEVSFTTPKDSSNFKKLSFQGILRNSQGQVIQNGTYQFTFKIYNVVQGGVALWSESKSINIVNGIINTNLGDVNKLELPFDTSYWLGIQVGTDTQELSPRRELTGAIYQNGGFGR